MTMAHSTAWRIIANSPGGDANLFAPTFASPSDPLT
ncbi:hypothetical protein CNECB9_500029 [Cupriavidus necator]|uniref:Uncharacterized protein n=1 Tax=Cupriavidus necator TaxID=106590 RepID=A0A1K0J078_CUPNE|nr:hypothetical protein CNECB9_500029 [Cupriavidus necator]